MPTRFGKRYSPRTSALTGSAADLLALKPSIRTSCTEAASVASALVETKIRPALFAAQRVDVSFFPRHASISDVEELLPVIGIGHQGVVVRVERHGVELIRLVLGHVGKVHAGTEPDSAANASSSRCSSIEVASPITVILNWKPGRNIAHSEMNVLNAVA